VQAPLRVGLIGAGRISAKHLEAATRFPDQLRYAAVADVDEAAACRRAVEAGTEHVFTDGLELIRRADIDAVDICSVADSHAEYAIAAAEAGKHVLVEKPMAVTMRQCREMVSAAQRAGVTLMVAHNQRYMANYRAVRRAVREGELGEVRAVRIESLGGGNAPAGHWQYDAQRSGGGVVITMAIHRIDLARFFAGEVRRVTAICRSTRPEMINGAEDWAWAMMEFESGAVGDLLATWSAFRVPWGESFVVFGEKGTVHAIPWAVKYREPSQIASEKRSPPREPGDRAGKSRGFVPLEPDTAGLPTGEMYIDEMLHFAECCRTGAEPVSSGRDNLGTMRVVFGIYESARRGAAVELSDVD